MNKENTPNRDRLVEHYTATWSAWGRLSLKMHLLTKRIVWRCRTNGGTALKRAFDVIVSCLLLAMLCPFFGLIGLFVMLEDGGPVFFAQTRVGQNGREFKMFKIRSMCLDAEEKWHQLVAQNRHAEGVTFKIKDDPRITKVGRWLRKFSLDELPQIFNVLIGDMSLVGPRPPLPREVKRYSLEDHQRLSALPGITCVWQISGRSEIDFAGQVRLDVQYIENQSFWTDLNILARTLPAVISGKGAC